MTGDLVKAMRACPQPIVAAIDGVCAGAGAILAMASDLRLGTDRSRVAFLFVRVGLVGRRHGRLRDAAAHHRSRARAAELLYTGRAHARGQAPTSGAFTTSCANPRMLLARARACARALANGPTLAHAMTKRMLHEEWAMPLDEAIDAEARAQAECMESKDFRRAYDAFAAKQRAAFRRQLTLLELPFFDEEHRAFAAALGTLARASGGFRRRARCRRELSRLGARAWRRRMAARLRRPASTADSAPTSTRGRSAWRAKARAAFGAGRFCLRHAGLGKRADRAVRLGRAAAPLFAARASRRTRSRPSRSRSARPVPTLRRLRRARAATATRT